LVVRQCRDSDEAFWVSVTEYATETSTCDWL